MNMRKIFECVRCGHCCHGVATVALTVEEQKRVGDFLDIAQQELFEEFFIRNGNRVEMRVVDGHCIFFGTNGLCRIHPVKPFHCRRWPLHPSILHDQNAWQAIKADCPGFADDATWEEAVELVRSSGFGERE